MQQPLIVLKLGGSVLSSEAALPVAVHEVYRWRREGFGVVAVVSAFAGETDALLARAPLGVDQPGAAHATAALAALGELRSAALLGAQLAHAGLPARVLQPAALRFLAQGDPLDAQPVALDSRPLRAALRDGAVAVVPGFFAHDASGRAVLLGRGGSDLSALFLASQLGARCRLVKDVDGLFTADPAAPGPPPARYAAATWDDALATDGSIVQHKAVAFARAAARSFEIARVGGGEPSRIGAPVTRLVAAPPAARPLRVALLGLGVVGGGVLAALRRLPERFEVVVACARAPSRRRDEAAGLALSDDAVATAACGADVVVEALGGIEPARTALAAALRAGAHVVSANKAVLAAHGSELEALAAEHGVTLRASAAAGGAMPLLPTLRRLARTERVLALDAVLNGTSNFVLDAVARGATPEEGLALAREAGLCERDATRDLSGRDAADKLVLAAHAATGRWLDPATVRCAPLGVEDLRRAGEGVVLRQVASLRLAGGRLAARVRVATLAPGHPLASVRGADNAAIVRTGSGRLLLRGPGAGRAATTEAVLADMFELARETPPRQASQHLQAALSAAACPSS